MITAYIVYLFLLIFLVVMGMLLQRINISTNKNENPIKNQELFLVIAIIFFYSLILGIREDTGIDYTTYKNYFNTFNATGNFYAEQEFLFKQLITITSLLSLHYNFIIFFLSTITISSFLLGANKYKLILPLLLFFFAYIIMLPSVNIMRQNAAFCLCFLALVYFVDKKYTKSLLWFSFAVLTHRSSLFYLLFLPILRKEWFKFWQIAFFLRIVSFIFGKFLFDLIFTEDILSLIDFNSRYMNYVNNFNEMNENNSGKSKTAWNIFDSFILIIDLLVIYNYNKIKIYFSKWLITPFYNFFVLGSILMPIFMFNPITSRLVNLLVQYRLFMLSLLIYFLWKTNKITNRIISILIIFAFVGLFIKFIFNQAGGCAPFHFLSF